MTNGREPAPTPEAERIVNERTMLLGKSINWPHPALRGDQLSSRRTSRESGGVRNTNPRQPVLLRRGALTPLGHARPL